MLHFAEDYIPEYASEYVTRDFFQQYYAVFFSHDCLAEQGNVNIVGTRVEGPKVDILGTLTVPPGGASSSAFILEGAVNAKGAAVLYSFRMWSLR